jgi:iron complex outermembrane recepter protein
MGMGSKFLYSVAAMAILAEPAFAQGAGEQGTDPEGQIADIIVTGLKRDERFIDAPVSVQVFSEEAIEDARITRPQDFLALTPNVTFIQSNHAGEAFVNVRGQTSVRQSESAVAVVIDGVQLATQNEFNGELFDIAQIEVLKGPQGAIYGRNAAAGAIIITTKKPTDDLEGNVMLSYGNWNASRASASISGALIPGKLRARTSVAFSDSDGPFTNIITNEKTYRSNEKLGRLRLDWDDGGPFKADLRFNISRLTGGAIAANAQGPGIRNGGVLSPVNGNATDAPYVNDAPGFNRQDKFSTSLKMDYDFGGVLLTSVSSWNQITDNYQAKLFPYHSANDPRNDAGNAILFGDQTQKYRIANRAFTQELRLSSNSDGPFNWQAGLYYLKSKRGFITEQGFNGRVPLDGAGNPIIGVSGYAPSPTGAIFASLDPAISNAIFGSVVTRWDRLLIGGGTILPTLGIDGLSSVNPTNAYDDTLYEAENFAPFANFQYDITENLELGVAGRYDIEKRSVETRTPDVRNPFTGGSFNNCVALFARPADACVADRTFKQFQPKVTLTYKFPSNNGSIFASYGRSFKSGGFNAFGTREIVVRATQGSVLTRAQAEALVFVNDAYDKEVADAYELGFKVQGMNRRLSVNGAVFQTDIKNAQQFIFFPAGSVQAVQSVDKVRIRGFELDANMRVSDTLTLFAGYGYIDPVIKAYRALPAAVGNRAPYVSKYNLLTGFQLNQPLSDNLELNLRGEYTRQGSIWFDAANTPGTARRSINLVNARLGIGGDRWELAAWSRNLFNEKYRAESVVLVTGIGTFNPGFPAAPRSYGLDLKFNF